MSFQNKINNPYYREVAKALGISGFDSENDINQVEQAASRSGIKSLSSQNDVSRILQDLSKPAQNSTPASFDNAFDSSAPAKTSKTIQTQNTSKGKGSINNPADDEGLIRDKLRNYLPGYDPEFVKYLLDSNTIPEGISELGPRAWENFTGTLDKTADLYKEKRLTDLRGQISKELAEMYNETEIGKSKIAAQSAIDVQRQSGLDAFRTGMKQSYSQILANV